MPIHGTNRDDEFEHLLANSVFEAEEQRKQERLRAIEWQREIRLQKAFERLNVDPGHFHDETKGFSQWYDLKFSKPPTPPPEYWEWYAERLIHVADQIKADGWEPDLEELEVIERPGVIALGLLRQALTRDVGKIALNLELAMRLGAEGQEVKAWLAIRIVAMLRGLRPRKVESVKPTDTPKDTSNRGRPSDPDRDERIWKYRHEDGKTREQVVAMFDDIKDVTAVSHACKRHKERQKGGE